MTLGRLLLRNLLFHRRGNLAVLLGVAVGTAVLTGALLVGDSLRGSLRDLTRQQLRWVDQALVAPRFVRADLARQLPAEHAAALIVLQGAVTTKPSGDGVPPRRAAKVMVYGVDEAFWRGTIPPAEGVVLNSALAEELHAAVGDAITLHLQKASAVPRETLLGRRDAADVVEEITLEVDAVLAVGSDGDRFNLTPSVETPRIVYVPLHVLQEKLRQEGRANALLVQGSSTGLQQALHEHLTLDDWGLVLHTPASRVQALFDKVDRNMDGKLSRSEWRRRVAESLVQAADTNKDGELTRTEVEAFYRTHRNYISLESRQMLLELPVAAAARQTINDGRFSAQPILVYLANSISDGKNAIPYSVVAAAGEVGAWPAIPGLSGVTSAPPRDEKHFQPEDILLADWKDSPLQAKAGDKITLTYFRPEEQGRLREETATFRLRGFVPLDGGAADPDLTPEFPGITDKLDLRDWNPPFPYDNKRVQKRDEQYWEEYRTTPKAYISLAMGQSLWHSRFGNLTSIRLTARQGQDLDEIARGFETRLLHQLRPERGGLVFDDVRQRASQASTGGTDFGLYFLYFSFFLIVAALLLVGLLFRLNIDRRAPELGVLLATGYRRGTVRWLLLGEGAVLAVVGGLLGAAGAVLYAKLLLELLAAWWPGGIDRGFLRLHTTPTSFVIGFGGVLVVSVLTIAWATRVLGKIAPSALLAGETALPEPAEARSPRWSCWLAGLSGVGAVALLVIGGTARDHEARALSFFGGGALLLTSALAAVWAWMRRGRHGVVTGHGGPALARLGARNAARNPVRSLLTAGLLASATFLVVAVESFHREAGGDYLDKHAGSGGFALVGESDLPVYQDLNTDKGRDELNIPEPVRRRLLGSSVVSLRLRAGDDASCLNLYQPRKPRLLGVPPALVQRGGFAFAETEAATPEERANPWLLLEQPRSDDALPVFGEANTVTYMLNSGLGGVLTVPDDRGEPVQVRIVGLLKDSVFQGELLLSEANFLRLYPRQEGYQAFLVETPPGQATEVKADLETALAERGLALALSTERLQSYLAVENTYLATFQALGGLGLILGALGLAVVLLRGVWERRGELALLRALGYRRAALGWLVLAENGFLLLLGLGAGTVAALLAVAPHLTGGGVVPWLRLVLLLVAVTLVGLLSGTAAVAATLRAPLIPALRRE